jgi:16S rRNA (guanine966-N2)-methyltransferase
MKLRIIAGTLKGRIVQLRDASAGFRPTLQRTRESIAETVKGRIPGASVCDLCAGSGAFGFEMISRGAGRVDFVDSHRSAVRGIEQHAHKFGIADRCSFIPADVRRYVRRALQRYDIIYFDPPYDDDGLRQLVVSVADLLKPDGLLLYEHRRSRPSEVAMTGFRLIQTKGFGTSAVDFIEREEAQSCER